ncbi:GTP-binding protein [Paenibacillus sp. PR3]|uniref:sulfate adenylyltransferase n=1 Tax=Paenibacillus terricola TaxID=2763503 RepID=A0ABR8N1N2_9BACL|nr:GTP-binding protein [Paenibacillus terricola]MBD3922085.1 GTP-binding protein [Paenibacillus terricola]
MSQTASSLLKFITCGSVDDGKSTLIGHILYDSKMLYADQEQALMLDSQVGSRNGAIDYSLLLDGLMAEREQGITIDVAYRYFNTDRRSFIVADTPGHEEYTRNMAVGAAFADLAIILLDAKQGVLVQTRRHARICALMGIKHFIFAVNKIDLVGYDQQRFLSISEDIQQLRNELRLENAVIIPVSATEGDNVTKRSPNMEWYDGPALLEHLETVDISMDNTESGFYMPVQRVSRPDHTFRGFQGQIEAGQVEVGETLTILPSGETAIVKSIHVGDKNAGSAIAGQPVTIQLDREVDVSRGCVLTKDAGLKTATTITTTLLWMDEQQLVPSKEYWIKLGTKMLPAVVTDIHHKVDVNNGSLLPTNTAVKNELVSCDIVVSEPLVVDEFLLHKTMGALILIDRVSHATAACGVVVSVGSENQDGVVLQDGDAKVQVNLFDSFWFEPDVNMVLREKHPAATYNKGDALPLQSEQCAYPADFDLQSDVGFANIRGGVFTGFGPRNPQLPLLDVNGLEADNGTTGSFGKYRNILVRNKG